MKKLSKIMAAAACVACGAVALAGCGGSAGNAMTEADAAALNEAFVQARDYDGSYTLNEEYSSYVYYLSTTQYSRGNAAVTYDGESGAMGYYVDAESDGESYTMGYYTVPQDDGTIKQYVDFFGFKMCTSYAAGEEIELYYTSYADCMKGLFDLDITEGSSIVTVDGFAAYWQEFLDETINSIGEYFGITLTFADVEAAVESTENGLIFTFSSKASLTEGVDFLGVEISAYTADYALTVKVENSFITEISSTVNQDLTMKSGGETVNMSAVNNSKDTFTMAYDASIIPSDLSEYETEGGEGII